MDETVAAQEYLRLSRELLDDIARASQAAVDCGCGLCRVRWVELRRQFDEMRAEHQALVLRLDIAATERGELT